MDNSLIREKLPSFMFEDGSVFSGASAFYLVDSHKVFLRSPFGTGIITDKGIFEELKKKEVSSCFLRKLKSNGFVDGFRRFDVRCQKPMPRFFMVDFTTKCNMNCYYCLRHFPDSGENISYEQLDLILAYIVKYCKKYGINSISVQPWGGEPLITADKIFYMQDCFTSNNIYADISVQTNGLLLTDDICKKLHERKIRVGVSIDGCEEIQNIHRKNLFDENTYSVVKNNIGNLIKYYGRDFGTISVNSRFSLPYIEKSLDAFARELGIHSVKMNLMHPNCDEFDFESIISEDEIPEFIGRVLGKLISLNKEGYSLFDSNIRDKLLNLLLGGCRELCHSDGCTGGFTSVTFSREGDIYPCELVGNTAVRLGNINDEADLPHMILSNLSRNVYFCERKNDDCGDCDWFVNCRGGCTASCLSYNRKTGEVDKKECSINKYLYPELIKLILTDSDAVRFLTNGELVITEDI